MFTLFLGYLHGFFCYYCCTFVLPDFLTVFLYFFHVLSSPTSLLSSFLTILPSCILLSSLLHLLLLLTYYETFLFSSVLLCSSLYDLYSYAVTLLQSYVLTFSFSYSLLSCFLYAITLVLSNILTLLLFFCFRFLIRHVSSIRYFDVPNFWRSDILTLTFWPSHILRSEHFDIITLLCSGVLTLGCSRIFRCWYSVARGF